MKKVTNNQSMDGFVPRRHKRVQLDESQKIAKRPPRTGRESVTLHSGDIQKTTAAKSARNTLVSDIDESLGAIDNDAPVSHRKQRKDKRKKRRIVKIIVSIVLIILLALVVWVGYKAIHNSNKIFGSANVFDFFQQQPLKMDEHGRSNVLIIGTTEDDPNHPGGDLTDSMMVLSVDQKKKDAYIFSIPRDLYVQFGKACNSGYRGKINEYYACSVDGSGEQVEKQRMDALKKFVGDIFGIDFQYTIHVNTLVIRDAVNAVGGITVDVQSRDPRGVLDVSLDWMCREKGLTPEQQRERCPTGHYLDLKNGPQEMDGDMAMWFSRARGIAAPTYGLEQSNFDRERNQQLVLMALKKKSLSTGTLTDFGKVTALMDAMGGNLRMDIEPKEIRTIMNLASEIKDSDIHRLNFVNADKDDDDTTKDLMTTGRSPEGASVVYPAAGMYNYAEIRQYLAEQLYGNELKDEAATVSVFNGGGPEGAAKNEADQLAAEGMKVVTIDNVSQTTKSYTVYKTSTTDFPKTEAKLKEIYGVTIQKGQPPFTLPEPADFVVVIGS